MMIFEAEQVLEQLPMRTCIDIMAEAIRHLAEGKSSQPLRTLSVLPDGNIFWLYAGPTLARAIFSARKSQPFSTLTLAPAIPPTWGMSCCWKRITAACARWRMRPPLPDCAQAPVSGLATDLLARKDAHSPGADRFRRAGMVAHGGDALRARHS